MTTENGRTKNDARQQVEEESSTPGADKTPHHGTPEGGPSGTLPPNPVAEPGNPGGSPA